MKKLINLSFVILIFVSCGRLKLLRNFEQNSIPDGLSQREIISSVKKAGETRGWIIKRDKKSKNHLIGILMTRQHRVDVSIPIAKDNYKILYRDSKNMQYRPSKRQIHRAYFKWVVNLKRAIDKELMHTSAQK